MPHVRVASNMEPEVGDPVAETSDFPFGYVSVDEFRQTTARCEEAQKLLFKTLGGMNRTLKAEIRRFLDSPA